MASIKFVFVNNSGLISDIIKDVERLGKDDGDAFVPSHCGLIVDDHFREALSNGFVETDIHRYSREVVRVYEVDVADEFVEAGHKKFEEVTGRPYGYRALVDGFLYTTLGLKFNGDGEATGDCSEDDTIIGRAYGIPLSPDVPADCITPQILYEQVKAIGRPITDW
jgi:hypothetical protein